ncbi:MAG: aminopeptidase [Deltaproteobacteria bacterium]|jgi:aspartyl aminopeptidase|nr:aminopeptidase [Deltaproteobacteria bacterium]
MKKTTELAYKPQSAWERYASPRERKAMDALAARYLDFLTNCKTERETIAHALRFLQKAGYGDGVEGDLLVRPFKGKALFAARKGALPLDRGLRLISAHADSPRLDLKQRPLVEQAQVLQAKTHYYGGLHKYQWLARPLALHGVLIRQDASVLEVTLGEDPAEPVFAIADLLPHLAKDHGGQKMSEGFSAEKLNLLLGHCPALKGEKDKEAPKEPVKQRILELLSEKYRICEEDFISAELQAVPAGPARLVGLDGALSGGYGQDDRICVFAALEALARGPEPAHASVLVLWDKEEIGSEGSTSAHSRFLDYCLEDLAALWQPGMRLSECLLRSRALSADVAAGLDPDWQELHDKQNAALMGHGPCFSKFTGARGKYGANDAHAEYVGWIRGVLNAKKIPWQMAECGKVDQGGGGTVALFLAAYGMDAIDMGPPLLSMHSPFELAGKADLYASVEAFAAFLAAT